ncbi:hypothetical protein OAK17_07915 [Alphaproteobacteria bacterium]|nr:hypothetical protein [Alphaproteobacteria bacterium]
MSKLNEKSNRIIFIIQCSVKCDPEEFQIWARDRASKYVYDLKEENSISYEWHLSADNKEATLVESFVDSDGAMQRLSNHAASPLASEVFEVVDIKDVFCLGNANQDLVETLTAWDAKFQRHFCGYHK